MGTWTNLSQTSSFNNLYPHPNPFSDNLWQTWPWRTHFVHTIFVSMKLHSAPLSLCSSLINLTISEQCLDFNQKSILNICDAKSVNLVLEVLFFSHCEHSYIFHLSSLWNECLFVFFLLSTLFLPYLLLMPVFSLPLCLFLSSFS